MAVSKQKTEEDAENLDSVTQYICGEIKRLVPEAGSLNANTDLTTDVNIDSVAIMDMVFALEEAYDISIPLNDLADTYKIGDLAKLVKKLKDGE